jgi:DNA-binding IclR family transcriptional regulator
VFCGRIDVPTLRGLCHPGTRLVKRTVLRTDRRPAGTPAQDYAQAMTDVAAPSDASAREVRRMTSSGVRTTLRVLDLLAGRQALQLSEISRELGLPKSTLHRVCSILVERAWAVRGEEGRYSLGIRALALGSRTGELPIVVGFRSVAADLLTKHNETVCLAALDGDDSVFVAIEETSHPVRLLTHVGSRTPAFASASGRVILAGRPPESLAGEYGGRPLVTPTGRRLNGVAELRAILGRVRRDGYAENDGETAVGLHALSVPVTNAEGVTLAALTVCIPSSRMSAERRDTLLADLRAAGARFSELVHWLPAFTVGPDVVDTGRV